MKQRAGFSERVLRVVSRIPRGKTLTYMQVARRAGSPRAYRAVGNTLNRYDARAIKVPCHRVARSDGNAGGYRWGAGEKRKRLKQEGVFFFPNPLKFKELGSQ